ncbi:nitrile hydratase accessory protein [Streptomyces sp. NPDC058440]|uniref:nitrile hydratase accessory protein n=1 Tax=Streptomyces sp. NPDC058440 TaxID=3346501 RepID=UPI0036462F4C
MRTEPWESRAFGMAVRLYEAGTFTWPEFQAALIARIAAWKPERPRASLTTTTGSGWRFWKTYSPACPPCRPPGGPVGVPSSRASRASERRSPSTGPPPPAWDSVPPGRKNPSAAVTNLCSL